MARGYKPTGLLGRVHQEAFAFEFWWISIIVMEQGHELTQVQMEASRLRPIWERWWQRFASLRSRKRLNGIRYRMNSKPLWNAFSVTRQEASALLVFLVLLLFVVPNARPQTYNFLCIQSCTQIANVIRGRVDFHRDTGKMKPEYGWIDNGLGWCASHPCVFRILFPKEKIKIFYLILSKRTYVTLITLDKTSITEFFFKYEFYFILSHWIESHNRTSHSWRQSNNDYKDY